MPFSLVLVGDILTGRGVAPLLNAPQTSLRRFGAVIAGADLALGNLEAAPKSSHTGRKPFFNVGDLAVLRAAGFGGLNLANNHSLDAGEAGARKTLRELKVAGIQGAGLSLDGADAVPVWNIGGRRVAVVSATQWGPFEEGKARLTRLDVAPLRDKVRALTAQGVFVVVSLHWGTEGVAALSPEQRATARSLIDAGAVAIWGHHPHVAGPVESYRRRPIFASTGNFLWDTMPRPQSGLLARLTIDGATLQTATESWQVWDVDPQARCVVAPPTPKGETRVCAWAGRFDADPARVSWILWTRTARGRPVLRALEQTQGGFRVRATGFPRAVAKAEVGDLSGDGRDELVVELRQRSKLDPRILPRLHVYALGAGGFRPLWRGSQLSRPFFAWTLAPRADEPGADLAALERGPNGTEWLCVYRWNGFGLRAVWQQPFAGKLRELRSGVDAHGVFLCFEAVTVKGVSPLRARRTMGENWQVTDMRRATNYARRATNYARRATNCIADATNCIADATNCIADATNYMRRRAPFISLTAMKSSLLLPLVCSLPAVALAQSGTLRNPALSPDGTKLVFERRTAGGSRLFVGRWNGKSVSGARAITRETRGDDIQPAWRPDGKLLVFASKRGLSKRFDLYTIRPDGTGLKRLTNTPNVDETEPSFTPRRFTVQENGGAPFVPDRSASHIAPSELRLIQRLAGSARALQDYEKNYPRPSFGAKVGARFYKILARQGMTGNDGKLLLMRDDGSDRRVFDAGMAGDTRSPRLDPTGRGMAFVRSTPSGESLYFAGFPTESEVMDDKGNSKGMSIDLKEWRKSVRKLGAVQADGQLAFSPNGEVLAAESGAQIHFFARPDTPFSKITGGNAVGIADGHLSEMGLFFARDGKSLFLPTKGAAFHNVENPDALADVPNLVAFSGSDEIEGLTAQDRPLLALNGFVVGGAGAKQMFALYEETDYANLPVFVSSDALLHLNHLVFDSLLRETETKHLLPATVDITRHFLQASIQQSRVPALREDALANAAYWAVAARLLRGEVTTGISAAPSDASADDAARLKANLGKNVAESNALAAPLAPLLAALPPEAKRLSDAEIALIKAHSDRASSPIFGGALTGVGQPKEPLADTRIDYTQFAPRGHYTRTEALRRFFLASRWLSGAPFRATPAHLRRALLLASAMDAPTQAKLRAVSRIMAQFVGESDDRRFLDVVAIARGVYGETIVPDAISDAAKLALFGAEVDKLPRPRIAPTGGPAMTLFPAPYTLDAGAMQNLIYDRKAPDVGTEAKPRFFALGLDAMGVLGSDRARTLLDTFTFGGSFFDFGLKESGYQNYDRQFLVERAKLNALPEAQWKRSFYAQTLWSLKPLLGPQANPRYRFTQSPAWADKQLNASLGAWAELKHDTMPKQPVAIEAGGEGGLSEVMLEEQPQGVVEPSPELFKRLRELVSAERLALAGAGYLSAESDDRLGAFGALLDMVTRLEAKQRANEPFTKGETEQLRFFGTFLEHLTLISSEGQAQTMEDSDMALVADVASALSTREGADLRVLEEGVGHALPLYVAFERDGRRQLARGAAYSYYEFTQPASERLSDAAWQELLRTPQAPKLPEWTRSFVSRVEK